MAENKIIDSLGKILGQVETTIDGLHTAVTKVNFSEIISEGDIEKLRLHLGYAKSYSDLAKTRLIYQRVAEYDSQKLSKVGKKNSSPRIAVSSPTKELIRTRGGRTGKFER